MKLLMPDIEQGCSLAQRVAPKYAPVWRGRPLSEQAALALYFLPHSSTMPVLGVTRPRVVKWYCPFADQRVFPSGHRYCINVYTGCSHGCVYCYAAGYLAMNAKPKPDFRRLLLKDLEDIDTFDVPPAPVHLSNSTDAFQEPLEAERGDALFTLQQIARCRHRFTTVTLLTKNPDLLTRDEYLNALLCLRRPDEPVVVEVSLAFWREDMAAAYDPGAATIASRLNAIRQIRTAGLPVVLRISPTYPLGLDPPGQSCPQSFEDINQLVKFAAEVGITKVVHTPAKIVMPKHSSFHPLMQAMLRLYRHLAGPKDLDFHGGAWRLSKVAARKHIVEPLLEICRKHDLTAQFCMQHLVNTP